MILAEGCGTGAALRLSAMGCEAALIQTTSVVPDVTYAPVYCRSPAVRGRVRSHENREIPDERSIARSAHITGFCPQGVGSGLVRDGAAKLSEKCIARSASTASGQNPKQACVSARNTQRTQTPIQRAFAQPQFSGQFAARAVEYA
ncbi:hypothetical protein DND90_13380 [Pseudomonas syringae pv. maculicola]|nr:hypothetical protein DND90_13380 [Pseudomonas syringae pv. maculicola]